MDKNALKVRLGQIGPGGFEVDEQVDSAWLVDALGADSPYRPDGGGQVAVHLEHVENGVVRARGRVRLALKTACSRCLDEVEVALDSPVEVTLFQAGSEPEANADGELDDADMGVATYEGDEIELRSIVRDEVFLELPMNPACSTECVGLCSKCGANLNKTACTCEPASDDRWGALRSIKLS